ncbi:cation-transporting ATPase I [Nocardia transvalensis]|uniref:Cation-transporting ATPase I n=1 Tax=Nocardia transvalensis TaxID=37333 RepID=A0A7W9UJK9_9NOCA|nr:cation-translocating P-type ATPase [Nocardia transvalensis]MBB5915377.1 cation-transporting ATPase I [Nocardia transvalensis]
MIGFAFGVTSRALHGAAAGLDAVAELAPQVGRDLRTLLDPGLRRSRRISAVGTRLHVEVRGLASADSARIAAAVRERLRETAGVRGWRFNAATGHTEITVDAQADRGRVVEAVAAGERAAGVAEAEWDPTATHPADLEPALAAGVALVTDLAAAPLAAAGTLLPRRAPVGLFQAVTALAESQPRLRDLVERRVGRARADLLLATANAVGQAAGESPANLLADAGLRTVLLVEATTRYARWRAWESRPATTAEITEPLPGDDRPADLPGGPVERSAAEAATGSLAGTITAVAGAGVAEAASALALGAPKAARTTRESYAALAATTLAAAGVLTVDPGVWRRMDRISALVVDGAVLLGPQAVVLDAEPDGECSRAELWSAAQHLLLPESSDDDSAPSASNGYALHPEPGDSAGVPRWHEVRRSGRAVGRVLVGREVDGRAPALLSAARDAGLRVVLTGDRDSAELRALADEFVPATEDARDLVRRLQHGGHGVAVLSARAAAALASADAGIGITAAGPDGVEHVPWSADALCTDLGQVSRVLATIAPARQASARGRVLALSACSLGGLLLATGSRRARDQVPVTAAQLVGLGSGAVAAWRAATSAPVDAAASLLPWHALEPRDVLARLPEPGTPEPLAPQRNSLYAFASRPLAPAVRFTSHVRRELADPLTPVLGVGATASAILGSPTDAVLVGSVLAVNAVASAAQRQRAEGALRHLLREETLTARRIPRAQVSAAADAVEETLIDADQLRPGDTVTLRTGDVVPADGRLLRAEDLEMDESALTGESVTVEKSTAATPGADLSARYGMVYEGSTVVNGWAAAVVVAVGADTEARRAAAGAAPPEHGGVQAQLRHLTERALPLTIAGGSVVTALGWLRARPLRAAIADGVAVATAVVPEGLPLVATVAQLAAARRLTRRGVLVRTSRTVEALGRVDTVCFDKTGTLTHGRLSLAALATLHGQWDPTDPDAQPLLRAAARACPDPDGPVVHATDRAVLDAADEHLLAERTWDALDEVPFESNRGYAAAVGNTARHLRLMVKGAPEVLLPRCTRVRAPADGPESGELEMSEVDHRVATEMIDELAQQGLRVLVVARRDLRAAPDDIEGAVERLTLLGFLGLADTPRSQARPLVSALRHNDIGVRIITGDHPITAAAIARQLGIDADAATTGADLEALDSDARTELIERSTVFARVSPRQKVDIVAALQRSGHVVAMAGDGGNDAAAIRTADIGIGLAARGSTAARNAADLVLTDPDPLALLAALTEGRSMWRRVTDAVGVLVGGNAGELAFTVLGTAVTGRAPLGTRQFLLVNMLTDMFPAMAVALAPDPALDTAASGDDDRRAEALAAELAARPPADLGADLLRVIARRGVTTTAATTAAWTVARYTGTPRRAATVGLVTLIGTQLGQTLAAGHRSPLVWVTTTASAGALVAIVMTPGLCTYFGCRPLGPVGWTIAATASGVATVLGRWGSGEPALETASATGNSVDADTPEENGATTRTSPDRRSEQRVRAGVR